MNSSFYYQIVQDQLMPRGYWFSYSPQNKVYIQHSLLFITVSKQ